MGNIILMTALAGLLAVAVIALAFMYREIARNKRQQQEQARNYSRIEHELRAMTAAAVGVDERISRLERRSRRIQERQEQLELHDSSRPYDQAIRMVHKGSSIDEIISLCDLSRSEAELIQMMHSMDKAS